MVRILRGYAVLVVLSAGLLNGCSWFFHSSSQEKVAKTNRAIDVDVIANVDTNPNAAVQAQPIKVCVIETSRPGWIPEGVGDGAPCRDGPLTDGVLSRNQSILQPGASQHYHFEVPAEQERWIVIGAEFQKISGTLPLAEQKSPALADSQIKVMVGITSLSVVAKDKTDE